jgi:hypothetical protein
MIFDIPKERQSFLNVFNGALFLVKADAMRRIRLVLRIWFAGDSFPVFKTENPVPKEHQ